MASRTVKQIGRRRGPPSSSKGPRLSLRRLVGFLLFSLVVIYLYVAVNLFWSKEMVEKHGMESLSEAIHGLQHQERRAAMKEVVEKSMESSSPKRYHEFREIAVQLAGLPPPDILSTLENTDPFGVRSFEKRLLQEESKKGAVLSKDELKGLFPCPRDRISLPDQRDRKQEEIFR